MMTGQITTTKLQPRTTRFPAPRLALRERSANHPMVMFAVAVTAAFASMVLIPTSGPAFASVGGAPMKVTDAVRTTDKTSRLPGMSETDVACQGQSWGAETADCLLVIARENGNARPIRMIASAEPNAQTPNIF